MAAPGVVEPWQADLAEEGLPPLNLAPDSTLTAPQADQIANTVACLLQRLAASRHAEERTAADAKRLLRECQEAESRLRDAHTGACMQRRQLAEAEARATKAERACAALGARDVQYHADVRRREIEFARLQTRCVAAHRELKGSQSIEIPCALEPAPSKEIPTSNGADAPLAIMEATLAASQRDAAEATAEVDRLSVANENLRAAVAELEAARQADALAARPARADDARGDRGATDAAEAAREAYTKDLREQLAEARRMNAEAEDRHEQAVTAPASDSSDATEQLSACRALVAEQDALIRLALRTRVRTPPPERALRALPAEPNGTSTPERACDEWLRVERDALSQRRRMIEEHEARLGERLLFATTPFL